jgi:polyketide biosynthesis 3-hydroxy-3-methylglutaryl-CoA synthase-like enzyme PksG
MDEYHNLLNESTFVKFGTRNLVLDKTFIPKARSALGQDVLFLKEIKDFHRDYEWCHE